MKRLAIPDIETMSASWEGLRLARHLGRLCRRGAVCLSLSAFRRSQWLIIALLTLVSGSATVKLPAISAHISVSETFLFSAVILFGPSAGVATVILDALIITFVKIGAGSAV